VGAAALRLSRPASPAGRAPAGLSGRGEDSCLIRWIVRTKKNELPHGAGEEDQKPFANARSYTVRVDEMMACRKCASALRSPVSPSFRCRPPPPVSGDIDPKSLIVLLGPSTQEPESKRRTFFHRAGLDKGSISP